MDVKLGVIINEAVTGFAWFVQVFLSHGVSSLACYPNGDIDIWLVALEGLLRYLLSFLSISNVTWTDFNSLSFIFYSFLTDLV